MDQGAEPPVVEQVAKAGEQAQADVLHAGIHAVGQHQFAIGGHAGLPAAVQGDVLPPKVIHPFLTRIHAGRAKPDPALVRHSRRRTRRASGGLRYAASWKRLWHKKKKRARKGRAPCKGFSGHGTSAGSCPRCGCRPRNPRQHDCCRRSWCCP